MELGAAARARGSARASVGHLGRLIVTGRPGYRPGQVISLELVSEEAGVSRSLAREVLQVLHQKRLVGLQPRVGATVRPLGEWDVFDPDVIEWRLEFAPGPQMRSLTGLRQAIEPAAAFLAAEHASADVCQNLISLSRLLQEHGENRRFSRDASVREDYRKVDAQFHRALLEGSDNEMFRALANPVEKALNYRIEQDCESIRGRGAGAGGNKRFPANPSPVAMWLHRGLAAAVEQRRPPAAEAFARAILSEVQSDSLPLFIAVALEHALPLLDRQPMEGGGGWAEFEKVIMNAVDRTKALQLEKEGFE